MTFRLDVKACLATSDRKVVADAVHGGEQARCLI